eukprot:2504812-Pyramimonas_sp.AAC.1
MEAELIRLDAPLMFTQLLYDALVAAIALTFLTEVPRCDAPFGRHLAMSPAFLVPDHERQTETSDHSRELTIRGVSIETITQATAIGAANRALRTKTTIIGQHCYDDGDL